jgi:cyclophilin family peptidyl-prolyl cis-trans isomerase
MTSPEKRMNRIPALGAAALAAALFALASCADAPNLPEGLYARMGTSKGEILLKLEFEKAPLTVGNFAGLAEGKLDASKGKRYYDGLSFHRVVPGFVIQGGDPSGDGSGGPGYEFADEIVPELMHEGAGVLSMANAGPGTNGSQFFITLAATPWLDGMHSVFGKVVAGLDVVEKIEQGDTMTKVEILRVGRQAKAFKSDQAAWNKRAGEAAEAAQARIAAKRKADLDLVAATWPGLAQGADGLARKILAAGSGAPPVAGDKVACLYKGMLVDGTVFDESKLHGNQPISFTVGAGQVLPGLDLAASAMRLGEKSLAVIPPELAYGSRGAGGLIPPNAFIVFELEMIKIER